MRGGDGGQPFVLCLLARLTAFRFVPQSLVVKEHLLAARPDKVFITVNATNVTILKFRLDLGVIPFSIGFAGRLSL